MSLNLALFRAPLDLGFSSREGCRRRSFAEICAVTHRKLAPADPVSHTAAAYNAQEDDRNDKADLGRDPNGDGSFTSGDVLS